MTRKTAIDRDDLLEIDAYAAVRKERRAEMIAHKKNRRLAVGPNATMHFESYRTMLYQVQEMLYTERGGEEQLVDELMAYDPLIPKGNELVCTFMLEFEDPIIRDRRLRELGGIEETIALEIDGEKIPADREKEVERTTDDGKTSAIHFLRFAFTSKQADAFRQPNSRAVIAIDHSHYGHMAIIPEAARAELANDL